MKVVFKPCVKGIASVAILISVSGVYAQDVENLIPVASASVMSDGVPPHIDREKQGQSARHKTSIDFTVNSANELVMKKGENQIIPIAQGHLNRIITPFADPEITSTSNVPVKPGECGEFCTKSNVVYVATDSATPLSVFITEKGNEATAISLTLMPRKIPPREIFVKLDEKSFGNSQGFGVAASKKAESWERSTPYIETLRTLLRRIALNDIPQGYTMSQSPKSGLKNAPNCLVPGINVDFAGGQVIAGHSLQVFVGVAQNTSGEVLEFYESACGSWDVAAVTTWPHKVLEPGQKTEVYVVVKKGAIQPARSQRPSLISN